MSDVEIKKAAMNLAAILGAIMKMSDDVKNANSPLDMQGKLLALQKSLQTHGPRIAQHVKIVMDFNK